VRWCYWTANVLAVGTEVTAVALYMHFWFPASPGWIWIAAFSAVLIAVNARSVNVFGTVEYWFSAIKITAIVLFILVAGYVVLGAPSLLGGGHGSVGFGNYTAYGGFLPKGVWGMWVALFVALFSYLSIEMIAVAAGEAADPETAVARAFRATLVRLVLFYLLTLALVLAIIPWPLAGAEESPFVKVMRAVHLPWAAGILNFVILVAALSAMNSQLYITTRMMFSLARAGDAPARFGTLSARGVPLSALLASSGGIALAGLLSVIAQHSAFILMVSISAFGSLFAWMMIFITHYRFRRAHQRPDATPLRFRMWGFPATTVSGAVLMAAVLITSAFTADFRLTLVFGLPLLGLLSVLYLNRRRNAARPSSSVRGS
jgi:L-asparagine transporter-like permease